MLNTQERQGSLFDLWEQAQTIATEPTSVAETPVIFVRFENDEPTFVSPAQRETMRINRYAFTFRGKSLEEIEQIHKKFSGGMYRQSTLSDEGAVNLSRWYECMWSAETIALEECYRRCDERFLTAQTGEFWLLGKNGGKTKVEWSYKPTMFWENPTRLTIPSPHFEFRTAEPSEMSETGYRSHFLTFIPFQTVASMEDLLVQMFKNHFNVTAKISFAP